MHFDSEKAAASRPHSKAPAARRAALCSLRRHAQPAAQAGRSAGPALRSANLNGGRPVLTVGLSSPHITKDHSQEIADYGYPLHHRDTEAHGGLTEKDQQVKMQRPATSAPGNHRAFLRESSVSLCVSVVSPFSAGEGGLNRSLRRVS